MNGPASQGVETPSGKDTDYENFPVGSWLLPARLRPHVAIFYAFARAADDIADASELSAPEKIARLTGFEQALEGGRAGEGGFAKAHRMGQSLAETGIAPVHCLDLLAAFKLDATKLRYRDWDDLIDYCNLSAAPVGRYLLDLHGGSRQGYGASDALCNALQVINHLQDCKEDYLTLDRVYLPGAWFAEYGAKIEELGGPAAGPGLRRVLDRTLAGVDQLLITANALPGALLSRRLAMESGAILNIARALSGKLARLDPLSRRVALGKWGYLSGSALGALGALARGRTG